MTRIATALALLATLPLLPAFAAPAKPSPAPTNTKAKLTFKPGSKTPDEAAAPASQPAGSPATAPTPSPAPAPAQAGDPKGPALDESLRAVLGEFYDLLGRGEVDRAYELLVRDSPIAGKKQEVDDLKIKSREAIRLFGGIRGHELLGVEPVGSRLWRVTCISLGEGFPLRWRFYYYRPQETWRLIDIRVDDSLPELFNERREAGAPER
jgi:hypothetical protein